MNTLKTYCDDALAFAKSYPIFTTIIAVSLFWGAVALISKVL